MCDIVGSERGDSHGRDPSRQRRRRAQPNSRSGARRRRALHALFIPRLWFRANSHRVLVAGQASESLLHAQQAGEWITTLDAYPSLGIGPLLDSHKHDVGSMLRESLEEERRALALYRELLALVADRSVALEEFARGMIQAEELHAAEVEKMLRKPGELSGGEAVRKSNA